MSIRAWAFFSPRLDPVLDRGKRDKDAVVAPEVPARWPVGQAVFDLTFRTLFPGALRVFSRSALKHAWTGHREPLQSVSLDSFLTS